MSREKEIEKQRSILVGKISDLFNKYFEGSIFPSQFAIEFDEIMNSYDKAVYSSGLSVSIRKRLITLFDELKLNPINMKHLDGISREVGIGFNFEDGWHVIADSTDDNLPDKKIDF